MGIGFGREFQPRGTLGVAAGADHREDLRIVRRIAHDRHVGPVLGGRTQHRGTADVDVLDGVLHLDAGFGDRLAERIEVDADHVDELDPVLPERLQMLGIVAAGKQTAVDVGMEGLHATVADLGEARHVADVDHLDAAVAQQLHRAARGDHLPAQLAQALRKVNDARFVADAYQCTHIINLFYEFTHLQSVAPQPAPQPLRTAPAVARHAQPAITAADAGSSPHTADAPRHEPAPPARRCRRPRIRRRAGRGSARRRASHRRDGSSRRRP